jgi:hypothetical protein
MISNAMISFPDSQTRRSRPGLRDGAVRCGAVRCSAAAVAGEDWWAGAARWPPTGTASSRPAAAGNGQPVRVASQRIAAARRAGAADDGGSTVARGRL